MGTITKALELLNFFSRTAPELGLTEFVRLSGRDKATVHRHLVELLDNGFLEQDPVSRSYRLGAALLRLSAVREATHPIRATVAPTLVSLSEALGELVHFSLLQGAHLTPACHADPMRHGTQVHFDETELLPLHATSSGLAVLAFAAPALVQVVKDGLLPAFASGTITDPARLDRAVADARRVGLAETDRGFDEEVASIAAPVFRADGTVAGALAIAVPVARMTPAKRAEIRGALPQTIQQITAALGGQVPVVLRNAWAATLTKSE